MKTFDIECYSREIVESSPTERVSWLIEETRKNMLVKNTKAPDPPSVLNDKTGKLPVIIRKAMAERAKLAFVPVGIWDKQVYAGCFTLREERIVNTYALPEFAFPEEQKEGEKYGFGIYSMFGHISPDYKRLLKLGTDGIRKLASKQLKTAEDAKSRVFLQAVLIALEGLEIFASRHVDMLLAKAETEKDSVRRQELLLTADTLERVPRYPASSFFEACQSAWLLHLALQLTDNYLAVGRPDQYLYPYLEKDLKEKRITVEEAQELTDLYMLKFNERSQDNEVAAQMMDLELEQRKQDKKWEERKLYDIGQQRYNVRDTIDAINHWNQNVMIGGCIPETGEDATNLMTVMILEAFRRMRMTNPVLSIRLSGQTPGYLKRQIAITLKTGGGLPALYNDSAVIRGYQHFGVALEDARDYANNGCWECILPGKTDFYFIKLNALKCMEWTLNHGKCHIDGKQEVPDQGDVSEITDYEILYKRVMDNFRIVMEAAAAHMVETQHLRSIVAPVPLLSAFLEGPVEKGKDMTQMGARFILGGTIAEGISHVIDSLCAIRRVVFREKYCTMTELAKAIDDNFKGYEKLQSILASCPKYGANEEEADEIGIRLTHDYAEIMIEIDGKYPEMKFMPGIGTFSWYIAVGNGTGASADGRFAAEPVASNFSPSKGAMTKGITGALLSFSKMNQDCLPLGSPLDLGMAGQYVQGEEGTNRLVGLMDSFSQLGGNLMTISVADSETLRDAQKHPENYKDLRVRMGGWSAYFTMLSKEQQEHHIKKSEAGFF